MLYRHRDITAEFAHDLITKHGTVRAAAKSLSPRVVDEKGRIVAIRTIEGWLSEATGGFSKIAAEEKQARNSVRKKIDEVLEGLKLDPDEIKLNLKRISTWGQGCRNEVGKFERHGFFAIKVDVERKSDALLKEVRRAKSTVIKYKHRPPKRTDVRTVAIISDTQIGFLRHPATGKLTPTHDLKAIECARQIVADVMPDEMIWIGDVGDFPTLSKYIQQPEFQGTLMPTIDECHRILGEFESAAGDPTKRARTKIKGGNHDSRVALYAVRNAPELAGLRDEDGVHGLISFPSLVRLKSLNIDYIGEYPGGEIWLTDKLCVMHEPPEIGKNENFAASVIHGHTHKVTETTRVIHERKGAEVYATYDIGCLCRLDNNTDVATLQRTIVPADRGRTNWAQGIAIVSIYPDGDYEVEQIRIRKGTAKYRGKSYGSK